MYKKNICEYGVAVNAKEAARLMDEFSALAHGLRERLGTKHGLLDNYLRGIMTALSETVNVGASIEAAFDKAMPEFRGLCKHIKEGGNSEVESHPFYPVLKNYIDTHSIPMDSLFYESCCVGTFAEYTEFAMRRFSEERDRKLRERLEKDGLPEMRETLLCSEVDITADDIDSLFERLLRLFILISPAVVFIQGIVDQTVMSLLLQDKSTGDYVFQRLINSEI